MAAFKSKQEVAEEYFPHISTHSAINQLAKWINNCPQLVEKLQETGYNKRNRIFTGTQVGLIYEYLGEP